MRRTSARQVELPLNSRPTMADLVCRQCSKRGAKVVQIGWNQNGAWERAWCSIDCAALDGWPWLEQRDPVKNE